MARYECFSNENGETWWEMINPPGRMAVCLWSSNQIQRERHRREGHIPTKLVEIDEVNAWTHSVHDTLPDWLVIEIAKAALSYPE